MVWSQNVIARFLKVRKVVLKCYVGPKPKDIQGKAIIYQKILAERNVVLLQFICKKILKGGVGKFEKPARDR